MFKEVSQVNEWKVIGHKIALFYQSLLKMTPQIVMALLLLVGTKVIAWLGGMLLPRILGRTRMRESLKELTLQLFSVTVWLSGVTISMTVLFPTLTPGRLVAAIGLSSVAVGFAFKNIFENFFAGVLILWRFPFEQGDFVECDGIAGRVERVTVRNTLLREVDGQLVIVPNAKLFTNPVRVLTSQPHRRISIEVGVAYDTNLPFAREVIDNAVSCATSVVKTRPIEIFLKEFAGSSVNFEVTWWTGSTPAELRKSRDEVFEEIKAALDRTKIEIPFPQRTLQFSEKLHIDAVTSHTDERDVIEHQQSHPNERSADA